MKEILQVKNWGKHFEGAKSKTYKHQTRCIIPNKQNGLGYKRLLLHKNGEALYGAFVSLCLLLSRQEGGYENKKDSKYLRQGYLTDTGRISGYPLTSDDISLMVGFKESTIKEMLEVCTSEKIGWIEVIEIKGKSKKTESQCLKGVQSVKDTTRIPEGYCGGNVVSSLPQLLTLTSTSTINLDTYVQQFNKIASACNLSQIKLLNKTRKAKLNKRLSEKTFDWELILKKISDSDFLQGGNKSNWKVTFDWIIENSNNYIKILEGNYDRKKRESITDCNYDGELL